MTSSPSRVSSARLFFRHLPGNLVAACGLLLAGYLTLLTALEWPCLGRGGCDEVLRSDWGKIGPVPIALFATGAWALLFFLRPRAQTSLLLLMLLGALFMVGVQIFVLGRFCIWCNVHHGLILLTLLLSHGPRHPFFAVLALLGTLSILVVLREEVRQAMPSPEETLHLRADDSALLWPGTAIETETTPLIVLNLECPACLDKLDALADHLAASTEGRAKQNLAWYFSAEPSDFSWNSLFLAALFPLDETPGASFAERWKTLRPLLSPTDPELWMDPAFIVLLEEDFPHLATHHAAWKERLHAQNRFLHTHHLLATPLLVDEHGVTTLFNLTSFFRASDRPR